MVKLFNKLLLCAILFSCMPMQASLRIASQRSVAAVRITQTSMASKIANRGFVTNQHTMKAAKQLAQSSYKNYSSKNNAHYWGIGAALSTILAGYQIANCQDNEEKKYEKPWEHFVQHLYIVLQNTPWGDISKKYINELEQEKHNVMNDIFSFFEINQHDWQKFQAQQYHKFVDDMRSDVRSMIGQEANHEHVTKIHVAVKHAAEKIGFDNNAIMVICAPSAGMQFMSVKESLIIINPIMCNRIGLFNNEGKLETSLMRELIHLLHDDVFTQYCLAQLYATKKDKDGYAYELLAKKLSHFHEKRADILSSLTDKMYAHSGYEAFQMLAHPPFWLKTLVGTFGYNVNTMLEKTHPPFSDRYEYSKKVHEEMIQAMESKKNNK